MSDATHSRIAVLQHKRRQRASQETLSRISNQVGEPLHKPMDPAGSLQLQTDLYAKLKEMRAQGGLQQRAFPDPESAVRAVLVRLNLLGPEMAFEIDLVGTDGSGFFTGRISSDFLIACLQHGHEGVAAVAPGLESGVLLDVVLDDPLRGNFYEVEWW